MKEVNIDGIHFKNEMRWIWVAPVSVFVAYILFYLFLQVKAAALQFALGIAFFSAAFLFLANVGSNISKIIKSHSKAAKKQRGAKGDFRLEMAHQMLKLAYLGKLCAFPVSAALFFCLLESREIADIVSSFPSIYFLNPVSWPIMLAGRIIQTFPTTELSAGLTSFQLLLLPIILPASLFNLSAQIHLAMVSRLKWRWLIFSLPFLSFPGSDLAFCLTAGLSARGIKVHMIASSAAGAAAAAGVCLLYYLMAL
jgi:hypothetical protein